MAACGCKQCNPGVLNFRHFSSPNRGKKEKLGGVWKETRSDKWTLGVVYVCSSMQSEKLRLNPAEGATTTIWPLQGHSCARTIRRRMEADVKHLNHSLGRAAGVFLLANQRFQNLTFTFCFFLILWETLAAFYLLTGPKECERESVRCELYLFKH